MRRRLNMITCVRTGEKEAHEIKILRGKPNFLVIKNKFLQ